LDRYKIGFAVMGSLMTMIFLFVVNYLTSPNYFWSLYPAFALLFWPGSLIFISKGNNKQQAVFGSIWIIIFLITENYIHSPGHPWFLYAVFPVLWWPILIFCEEKVKTMGLALIGSISTILYYSILNFALSPGYPWAIFPTYVVLWWPISMYYARKEDYFGLSITASLFTILFFSTVNFVSSPDTIWAIYPVFIILWWPLSMYYFHFKRDRQ
jgi:hypothetical protein